MDTAIKDLRTSTNDLILFAGQSNMAGRGDAGKETSCETYMGWEFRAVSAPVGLHPIEEPFGIRENNPRGMDDGRKKTGSMVSAFVRKYHELTGHAVIAVSASKGGSSSAEWVETYAADAAMRLGRARTYLDAAGIPVAHIYVLWSQGETDGDKGLDAEQYFKNFQDIWSILREARVEKCFLIQTGHCNYVKYPRGAKGIKGAELDERYGVIRRTQEEMCALMPDVHMAASFEPYLGMMKDLYHYTQQAYNEVGETAAEHMAAVICRPKP